MKNHILLLLALAFIINACEEDETILTPIAPDISGSLIEWEPSTDSDYWEHCDPDSCNLNGCQEVYNSEIPFDYREPAFNPTNVCQLAYYRVDNLHLSKELWVADLCKQTYHMLIDDPLGDVHWTSDDWIVFAKQDRQYWRVRPDGSELPQLTHSGGGDYNRYLKYNPSADRYAYQYGMNLHITTPNETNEIVIDGGTMSARYWQWTNDEELLILHSIEGGTKSSVSRYNVETDETTSIYIEDFPFYYRMYLSPDNDYAYLMGPLQVNKLNLATATIEPVLEAVQNEVFLSMNVKPDDGRVIIQYVWNEYIGSCSVNLHSEFVLFDENYETGQQIVVE